VETKIFGQLFSRAPPAALPDGGSLPISRSRSAVATACVRLTAPSL